MSQEPTGEEENIIIEEAPKKKRPPKTEKAMQNISKAREVFQKSVLPKIKAEAAVKRDHKKQTAITSRMQKLEDKLSTLKVSPKVEPKPEPETRKQTLKKYVEPESSESKSESNSSESSDDEIIIVKKKKKQMQKTPKAKYTVPKPIQEKFIPPPLPPQEPEIRFY